LNLWESYIVKSGFVITKDGKSLRDMLGWMLGDEKGIGVHELASAMIDVALKGSSEVTMGNKEMVVRGREALREGGELTM
jgi:hypothetical protein